MVLLSLLPTVLQPSGQRWLDLFMVIAICNWAEVRSTADMYTYKPNHPCFDWKGPCFGGLTFKNRDQYIMNNKDPLLWSPRIQAPSTLPAAPKNHCFVDVLGTSVQYLLKVIKEWGSGSPPHLLRIMITHGLHKPPYSSETQWKTTETCGEIQYPRENGAGNIATGPSQLAGWGLGTS